MESSAEQHLSSFLVGFQLSFHSFLSCSKISEVQSIFFKLFWAVVAVIVGTFMIGQVLVFPARLVLWLGALFVNTASARAMMSEWVSRSQGSISRIAPTLCLVVMQYVVSEPLEQAFFAALAVRDAEFADELKKKTPISFYDKLPAMLWSLGKLVLYSPIFLLLSFIPGVGMLVSAWFQYKTARRWLEHKPALLVALVGMVPLLKLITNFLFQRFLAQMFFFYELMQPYFSRARLSRSSERALILKNFPLILGFIIPFSIVIYTPYLGPFTWVICQSAVSHVLVSMVEKPPLGKDDTVVDKKMQ